LYTLRDNQLDGDVFMNHEPFKILIVEDDPSDVDLIDIQLRKLDLELELKVVETKKEFKTYLEKYTPELILSDYNLPDFSGLEALEFVRELNSGLSFILISGYIGEEKAVEVMRKGASDYVLKDNLDRLGPAVKRELISFREHKKTEHQRDEAIRDLRERVKEQNCLYNISSLNEQKLSISDMLHKAVNYIPPGFQYPKLTTACIEYEGKKYESKNFRDKGYTLESVSDDVDKGTLIIKVAYLQKKPMLDIGPFLKEERYLLNSITETLVLKMNRILVQNELLEKQDMLEKMYDLAQIGNWELDLRTLELNWSDKTKEIHEFPQDFTPTEEKLNDLYKKSKDWPAIERSIENMIQKGESFDHEVRIITAKGNERWIRVMGQSEFKDGDIVRVYGSIQNIDKRKRAEEELQKSEQRFRSLVQDGSDLISILDSEGYYKYVSPTSQRLESLGMQQNDFVGFNCYEFIHKDDRERIRKTIADLDPGERGEIERYRFKRADGNWRWLETTITNMTDTPAVDGYVANSRDITDRIEQEKKLRDIVENSTNLFYRHDADHVITYISPQSEEFLGCSPKEAKKRWTDFVTDHPLNEEGFQKTVKAIDTGVAQNPYELQLQKVNGEIIWVEVNEAPVVENGETVAMVGSLTDITARKEALDKLISTEQKLREIVEHSTNLFYKHDVHHQLEYISPQSYDFVGLTPEEAMKKWTDLVTDHPINEEGFKKTVKAIKTGKAQGSYELQFRHVDGGTVWARVHEAPVVENGETVAIVGSLTDITEQKKYEEKLEELSLVAAKTTDVIIMTDADEQITWVNKAYENLTGYTMEESLGKVPGDFLQGPETNEETVERIAKALDAKKTVHEIILNYAKDGEKYWLDMKIDPIIEGGKCTGFIAIERDVTEQIEQKRRLQESVERYDIVTQATSDTIWDEDLENKRIAYNSNIYDVFGYKVEEVENSGDWWLSKVHPDDRERVDKKFKMAEISDKDLVQVEYRFQCADGSYKYIDDRAYIINDESGKPVRIIGAMQDITKQKEENLWLKLLESAIANSTEAIAIIEERTSKSAKRNIIYLNDAFESMTGFSKDDALGASLLEFIGPNTDRKAIVKGIQSLDKGEKCELEISYNDKENRERWVHISFAPVKDDDGDFTHWICIGRDVTERRNRVGQLRESLQEKETLLMEIHHRVKNNLALVSSMMQLQAMDEQDESLQKKLYDSVSRIRTMVTIHEMLYESGSFSKINFSVNIKKLVSMIIETIQNQADINVVFDCDEVELNVNQAIPSSLIVNETITNCIKHAFRGRKSGSIKIELRQLGSEVKIEILDDGIGLPTDFENKGTPSLGLQLIDVLSQQMDANYEYQSLKENGTRFSIQFKKSTIKGIGNAYLV
jgi:PAS domain S-box-containing protein